MAADKQISPEEKLLKVIQGTGGPAPENISKEEKLLKAVQGDGATAAADTSKGKVSPAVKTETTDQKPAVKPAKEPSPEPAAAPKPVPRVESQPAEKPKVEVAEKQKLEVKAQPKPEKAEPKRDVPAAEVKKTETPPAAAAAQAAGSPVADLPGEPAVKPLEEKAQKADTAGTIIRKRVSRKFSIGRINLGLAALVLIMLGLSNYEIWAAIQNLREIPRVNRVEPVAPDVAPGQAQTLEWTVMPYSLAKVLESFGKHDIFQRGSVAPITDGNKAPPPPDWMAYAKDGFSLAALMGTQEAVLIDKKDGGKLRFVKLGGKITINSQDITLKTIEDDGVILSDGTRDLLIK